MSKESEFKIIESLEKIQDELNNVKRESSKLENSHENTKIIIFIMILVIVIIVGAKIYAVIKRGMIQKVTNNVIFRDDKSSNV